jgi:hypothetical protein
MRMLSKDSHYPIGIIEIGFGCSTNKERFQSKLRKKPILIQFGQSQLCNLRTLQVRLQEHQEMRQKNNYNSFDCFLN